MCEHGHVGSYGEFSDYLGDIEPIRLQEPLAETLGVIRRKGVPIEYTFVEVIKLTGHACPTTAAAYECCRAALKRLYDDKTAVRGGIEITIYGAPNYGAIGVIAQVFTFITGAAASTGFKGLGNFYCRKDLLSFQADSHDPDAMCFKFRRKDNGKTVICRIHRKDMPGIGHEKAERLNSLMPKVLQEIAQKDEISEFRRLWMESIMLIFESAERGCWLKLEE